MSQTYDSFHVPLVTHLLSGVVHRYPRWGIRLGNLETSSLTNQITPISVDRPVYVTGLARAGTTVLLEFLAGHADVATHRYRDFPGVFVPYWWNQGSGSRNRADEAPRERAHADGLAVTLDSPEAMEECIWMAFFPDAHDPQRSHVLDARTQHPEFEEFYRDHIRKLLYVRGRTRYVSKGNYNLTRQRYLLRLFPDARFIVAVRHPYNHIASLVKQHRLFCQGETRHPRALEHMRRVGHYEFGLDRRPINTGDLVATRQVLQLWERGDEVRGLARYWAELYGWLADQLDTDPVLARAVCVIRFEDLCEKPETTLGRVQQHCELEDLPRLESFAANVQAPKYYQPDFSPEEEEIIAEETADVVRRFGYGDASTSTAVAGDEAGVVSSGVDA